MASGCSVDDLALGLSACAATVPIYVCLKPLNISGLLKVPTTTEDRENYAEGHERSDEE